MLGQSWMDEVLGDENFPNPVAPGETASVVLVVNGFLCNDMGLSREDISTYVDQALFNEARELLDNYEAVEITKDHWSARIEKAQADLNSTLEEEATARLEELSQHSGTSHTVGRAALAEAIQVARGSKKVLISPETSALVVQLDHDGYMSEAMGINVKEVFGANPDYDPKAAQRAAQLVGRPDFSREMSVSAAKPLTAERVKGVKELQSSRPTPAVDHSREPVKAGRAIDDLLASLREEKPPVKPETGPELG